MALKKVNDVEKTIEDIEMENLNATLSEEEIAEDGYIHDVPLLAGYVDENGIVHSTFTYREMNGKDEEAINKAEVRANGGKLANVLLERVVSEIGTIKKSEVGLKKFGEVIINMYASDLDYMLLKVREVSKGKEITFSHKCPNSKTKLNTIVNTDELTITPFNGVREVSFELPRGYKYPKGEIHKEGKLRRLTGLDRELIVPIAKKNPAQSITMLITRVMKFDDEAYVTNECVANMTTRDREYIEELMRENEFGLDFNIEVTCDVCGEDLSGEIGQSNFF